MDHKAHVTQNPLDMREIALRVGGTRKKGSVVLADILIGEPDALELDTARAITGASVRRRSDVRRFVEQFEDAFGCRHRRLQDVVFVAEVLDGAEEALRILNECDENAESDYVSEYAKVHDATVGRNEIAVVRDPGEHRGVQYSAATEPDHECDGE